MIEVSHLSRNFGTFRAVNDVNFSIPTGEIVGLLGPNGAGKSTTMRMITGFLKPSSGTITIDGKNIEDAAVAAKRKIGYMPEAAPLYAEMIVNDYLAYVARMQGQDPEIKVPHLCDVCGLKEVMHKNISELSRGYRQRVGLAHALMNDPEILILDEPTSGLDPNQIGEVRNLIKEIGKTRTVIISTHILGEVEMLCNRVLIITQGKLVADGPTEKIRERYGHSLSVRLTVAGCTPEELAEAVSFVTGVADVRSAEGEKIAGETQTASVTASVKGTVEIRKSLFRLAVANGWTIYELALQRNSLEEVFHALTTSESTDKQTPAVQKGNEK
ncbi:MAG: ABC transporter ATP-binding protein [Treponema sp.]|jgi:ABC-2 type transport system ATP-binding protein|nr:ABC transporter ATP-binding protein [Treponema sp.]